MNMKRKKGFVLMSILLLLLVLSGCMKTDYKGSENIIEAEELAEVINDAATVVIDARDPEVYQKGHLQDAINITPGQLSTADPVANMIAPMEMVEEVLSKMGISNSHHIYVYDDNGGVSASRIWWVLKSYGHEHVKVVNNGEKAIVEKGLPLTLEVPEREKTTYQAKALDRTYYADITDVEAVVAGNSEACILDVRSRAEFDEGAIPGAVLYPHTKNLYTDGAFKSASTIYLDYKDLGLTKDEPVILYCKSSFRATQTLLLLVEAGYTDLKVYDGAWLEWSQKDMPKEEKKEEVIAPTSQDGS